MSGKRKRTKRHLNEGEEPGKALEISPGITVSGGETMEGQLRKLFVRAKKGEQEAPVGEAIKPCGNPKEHRFYLKSQSFDNGRHRSHYECCVCGYHVSI